MQDAAKNKKKTDNTEEECSNETQCLNRQQNYPTSSKSCDIYKRESEILKVKHKRNVTFLEARIIVGSYMGENTYASMTQRGDLIRQSNQVVKYRDLMEKLIQLEPND